MATGKKNSIAWIIICCALIFCTAGNFIACDTLPAENPDSQTEPDDVTAAGGEQPPEEKSAVEKIAEKFLEKYAQDLTIINGKRSWSLSELDYMIYDNQTAYTVTDAVFSFPDENSGFLVLGTDRTEVFVYATTDGGKRWEKRPNFIFTGYQGETLYSGGFVDTNLGIISFAPIEDENSPNCYITRDGGYNWEKINVDETSAFYEVLNGRNAYALSPELSDGKLYLRVVDGGYWVEFVSEDNGVSWRMAERIDLSITNIEDWDKLEIKKIWLYGNVTYYYIKDILENNVDGLENVKFGDYTITKKYKEQPDISYLDYYIRLDIEVIESDVASLQPGSHSLYVYGSDISWMREPYFTPVNDPNIYNISPLQRQLLRYISRGDYLISARGATNYILASNYGGLTEAEFAAEAERLFGFMDFKPTQNMHDDLYELSDDGKYCSTGQGILIQEYTFGEEYTKDGYTHICIRFYADWSRIRESCEVTYKMKQTDKGDYAFISSEITDPSENLPIIYY